MPKKTVQTFTFSRTLTAEEQTLWRRLWNNALDQGLFKPDAPQVFSITLAGQPRITPEALRNLSVYVHYTMADREGIVFLFEVTRIEADRAYYIYPSRYLALLDDPIIGPILAQAGFGC